MGDPFILPERKRIEEMIEAFKPTAPIAYALDVGVLDTGETMVVECNDFWALGTYGLDPLLYTRLAAMRWREMTEPLMKKDALV
jgi:hypothetical protein